MGGTKHFGIFYQYIFNLSRRDNNTEEVKMKGRIVGLILVVLLLVGSGGVALAGYTVCESYTVGDNTHFGITDVSHKIAQTFTVQSAHDVGAVNLKLAKGGDSGSLGTVTASIYATSGGEPTGGALVSGSIDGDAEISASVEWHMIALDSGYSLSQGVKYAIVLTKDDSRQLLWRVNTSGGYSGGWAFMNQGSWSAYADFDMMFEELSFEIETPSVATLNATDIEYNPYFDWWEVALQGRVEDDGGEECSVGFYYRRYDEPDEWSWGGIYGSYATSENFTITVSALEADTNYVYYAYAYNEAGSGNGSDVDFYTATEERAPRVTTYAYPIVKEDNKARLYGRLLDDGSFVCSVWMEYREAGTENWTATSNVTGKYSPHSFNFWTDNVTYDTEYEYQAIAENELGKGYGGIASFMCYENITLPVVETQAPTFLTDNSAWLNCKLVDDGGMSCMVWWQYRVLGASEWERTSMFPVVTTGTSVGRKIDGLVAETNYEYRGVARNEAGYGYGAIWILFTYLGEQPPVVSTGQAEYVDASTVRVRAVLDYDGGADCEAWFKYREFDSGNYTATDFLTFPIRSNEEYSHLIFELTANVTYQYHAIASNSFGSSNGTVETFVMNVDVSPDEPDVVPPDVPDEEVMDIAGYLEGLLAQIGFTGDLGKLLFAMLMMAIAGIALAKVSKLAVVIVEACLFIVFCAFGLIPIWVWMVVGIVAVAFVAQKLARGGAGG